MTRYCYFNGKITNLDKAKVDLYDIGLLRGYGVFDVMRTEKNKPFLLEKHFKRFENSAKELKLKIPIKKEEYKKILDKLITLNGFKQSIIRTILTGGTSSNGFDRENGNENFFILIEEFKPLSNKIYKKGAKLITLEYNRFNPSAKVTNYVAAIKTQEKKKKEKALEILYTKDGKALEASTSNFFLVKKGKIVTTKEDVLLGITRGMTIDLAKKIGLKVKERKVSEKELYQADEVFLTATNKKIVPVVSINNKKIGNGQVGETTKSLMDELEEFTVRY